jgi:hypothetical protein
MVDAATKRMQEEEKRWAIERDANALIEAETIKRDKDRFKTAKGELKRRAAAIKKSLNE